MKFFKYLLKLTSIPLCTLLLCSPVMAEGTGTPDGVTPAVEAVCDSFTGAAFGLCTAYCEAMDCDLGDNAKANPKACMQVKANFLKEAVGETALPCETLRCPCWDTYTKAGLISALNDSPPTNNINCFSEVSVSGVRVITAIGLDPDQEITVFDGNSRFCNIDLVNEPGVFIPSLTSAVVATCFAEATEVVGSISWCP